MAEVKLDTELKASTNEGVYVGIDIGGTNSKAVVCASDGWVLSSMTVRTHTDSSEARFMHSLERLIGQVVTKAGCALVGITGVGVGVPGIVEDGAVIGGIENLQFLEGINLANRLANRIARPVVVENDAFLMALAESEIGAAAGHEDVVFLTVGTGIGGALKLSGRFHRGLANTAGEVGHMIAIGKSTTDKPVRFQEIASMSALVDRYHCLKKSAGEKPEPELDGKTIIGRSKVGDAAAASALSWHLDNLAMGICSLISLVGPVRIVLGGGVFEKQSFYSAELKKRVAAFVALKRHRTIDIVSASLGNRAGSIGAALHASMMFKSIHQEQQQ